MRTGSPEGQGAEEGGLAQHRRHRRGRDRIPGLILLGWLMFQALFVTIRRAGSSFKAAPAS
jgi:hypothetical protein